MSFSLSILNVPLIICLFYISTSPMLMPIMLALSAASTIVRLFAITDAALLAKRTGTHYQLKNYNRPLIYLTAIIAFCLLNPAIAHLIKTYTVEAFVQPTLGSYPTLLPHDRILANKSVYRKQDPQRGDMVVFIPPTEPWQFFVQRVVAVAGDTVEFKDVDLYINGRKLERRNLRPASVDMAIPGRPPLQCKGHVLEEVNANSRYRIFLSGLPSSPELRRFPHSTVPQKHCFVLGDNRNNSIDSRSFGPIDIKTIVGRADYVYLPGRDWSRARDWSRFGRLDK